MGNLRSPREVMCLERMGASHQTRLSFMRSLIRRLATENWRFERLKFDVNNEGYGTSVYAAHGPSNTYSLVAFTHEIETDERSDRVIAEVWDATFNLFDGIPEESDILRLSENTPKQEAGRFTPRELSLSRANKSLRTFNHVIDALSQGNQPDVNFLSKVGYLMRTTAVYGSGKFGCADRSKISSRPELRVSFHAEMLEVYLIRWMTIDLVEHIARCRGGKRSVPLDPSIKRYLGIGNSTGLGMAPFLLKYPLLINNWVLARETALSRVRQLKTATAVQAADLSRLTSRVRQHVGEWIVEDDEQSRRINILKKEIVDFRSFITSPQILNHNYPWEWLYNRSKSNYSLEGQELIVSLLLEPHGDLIDDLSDTMFTDLSLVLDPKMKISALVSLISHSYQWALKTNINTKSTQKYFWYYSEDKLEPRIGERTTDLKYKQEMPLTIARDIKELYLLLNKENSEQTVAKFLMKQPKFRHIVRRIQTLVKFPYGEIYDSVVDDNIRPLNLLRFKLAFFGASKFDPKSDLWTRMTMFQGAPMPHDLDCDKLNDWFFPVKPEFVS